MKKEKRKVSKDKLIINLSDYFVLLKILETVNYEDQYFIRLPRLKGVLGFFLYLKGYLFQDFST